MTCTAHEGRLAAASSPAGAACRHGDRRARPAGATAIVAVQRTTSVLAVRRPSSDRRRRPRRRPRSCARLPRSSAHPAPPVRRAGSSAPCLTAPIDARSLAARTLTTDGDVDTAVVDDGDLVDEAVGRRSARPLEADRRVGDRIAGAAQGTDERALPPSSSWWPTGAGSTPSTATTSSARWRTSAWNRPVRPVGAELAVVTRQHARRGADAGDQLVQERLRHGLQSSRTEVYRSNSVARGFASTFRDRARRRHPTLTSVAEAAGVSRQTVSNIFNAPHKVHRETRARVEAEIARQGYRPNRSARSLRTRRSHCLGYCVPPPTAVGQPGDGPLPARHHRGRRAPRLPRAAVHPSRPTDPGRARPTRRCSASGRSTASSSPTRPSATTASRGCASSTSRSPPSAGASPTARSGSWVDVDGAAGTAAAVRHLAALGHRRLAFVGWPEGSGVGDDRYRGVVEAASASEVDIVAVEHGLTTASSGGRAAGHATARRRRTRQRPSSASATCSPSGAMPPSVRPARCPAATSPSPASTTPPPPLSPPCR